MYILPSLPVLLYIFRFSVEWLLSFANIWKITCNTHLYQINIFRKLTSYYLNKGVKLFSSIRLFISHAMLLNTFSELT